ncbi:MAG: lipoprotein LpqH [Arachnia sp.]
MTSTISAVAVVALAGLSACVDPGANVPQPGEGTGAPNASQPVGQASVGTIETPAPEGGAAARIGKVEETIGTVACTVLNGQWTMSGGDDNGAKVAVTASEDRAEVASASVVLSDGTVATMMTGAGQATIAWDAETFTVTGRGPVMNLNEPPADGDQPEDDFVITATCQG